MQIREYDLIIIGAGCVGIAAAYYACKKGWKVCIVQSQSIASENRYWSSSFSARQNRVQYNEEYLTRYVVESNAEWSKVEDFFEERDGARPMMLHHDGALWFGDENVTTNDGNIKAVNVVISQINAAAKNKKERLESLYMQKLIEGTPNYMKAFKPYNFGESAESEWDSWSSLYQPDGGSVDMKLSYTKFLQFARAEGADILDQTSITEFRKENDLNHLKIRAGNTDSEIKAAKILVSVGVCTPYFLKNVLKEPHLADHEDTEYVIQEYVASYMKLEDNDEAREVYDHLPSYFNFLDEVENLQTKEKEFSGYGFRFHDWDNIGKGGKRFVKFGTLANRPLNEATLSSATYGPITDPLDERVIAAKRYVRNRMNYLLPDDPENQHFPCPIIFYRGRQTLLDYLNRMDESIVVQSGGWIGKYYPLLAKTAVDMLGDPAETHRMRSNNSVIGNFINRTRFPITSRVNDFLKKQSSTGKSHFTNIIIGGGCSGLYAAYRLNRERREHPEKSDGIGNIGVFELSDRISGRLKCFKFVGLTTPIQLGGMRYIPTNHILVNKIITDLGIPSINFSMNGDPIQQAARLAYLRNDYYRMNEWTTTQNSHINLHTAYRIQGPIVGMDSFQIISFSLYMILTAPENVNLLTEVFLQKTDIQIADEKKKLAELGENVHVENSWYREWKNYIYVNPNNSKSYIVGLSLLQWNQLKPILLFRFRYELTDKQVYLGQEKVDLDETYPLYKFGFQNVIEALFGHEAYQFVSEQNGYFSNTSNASYLDQVMTYLLDFGNVSYRTLASGFDQINFAMANVLLSRGGLDSSNEGIFLHHKLVDILPGEGTAKYILVFHVPKSQESKNQYNKTPLKHCKKRGDKDRIAAFGERVAIVGDNEYDEIRFTADRIILGMPKNSVTNLANQVELLRVPIEDHYKTIYQNAKQQFNSIFNYTAITNALAEASTVKPLDNQQKLRLQQLRVKQKKYFAGTGKPLLATEAAELNDLSHVEHILSIQPIQNLDVQAQKPGKFDQDPPLIPKNLLKLADSTQLMPAMKIVMSFDRNWWDPNLRINEEYSKKYKNTQLINNVEEMRGVSVTDLPARQTLYFSNGPDNLLLASYNDMLTTEFWTSLQDNFSKVWERPGKVPIRRRVVNSSYPESMGIHPAKKVLVKQILKQLSLMHQVQVKETWVNECIYQFWGNDPYGGGYHNFYSGFYIPAVMKCIRKPWSNQNIHIVGEAYSNETGWVEGAFQTTELLLQEEVGLSELVPNYYAGY